MKNFVKIVLSFFILSQSLMLPVAIPKTVLCIAEGHIAVEPSVDGVHISYHLNGDIENLLAITAEPSNFNWGDCFDISLEKKNASPYIKINERHARQNIVWFDSYFYSNYYDDLSKDVFEFRTSKTNLQLLSLRSVVLII